MIIQQIAIFILLLVMSLPADSQEATHCWDVMEIHLESQRSWNNPYVEGLPDGADGYLKGLFKKADGDEAGREYAISGFWDGASKWTIRFAPPFPGKWLYRTGSPDAGMNGKTGELTCRAWSETEKKENPTRRGFIRVCKTGERSGRYFEYADGTPFLWIGDTWWNWTKRKITFESFQKLADDRSAKGFTVGQLFFAGRGWGRNSSLLDETLTKPDIDAIHNVEKLIQYANAKGITVWVHGWWGGKNIAERIGSEAMRRWQRYMVHRLGAYNVIWVEAGEYNLNNYGGLGLDFWKSLGKLIKQEDPYNRLVGVHPTPPGWDGGAEAPQWSTSEVLQSETWLDYNQSQVGHGKWRNERIPEVVAQSYAANPPKPIVVTEPWYEFIEGNPSAQDIRMGAWSAILSGAAGHSYGGGQIWKAHVPEAPAGKDSWPMEMNFTADTLDYPGAKSISFMAKFLKNIPWQRLEPHPELVLENPSHFCSARPGEEYVVFLRWGGTVKMDLKPSTPNISFHYRWYDLTQEKVSKEGDVQGGSIQEFHPPEDYPGTMEYKDWLLHIYKKS
jgi:hypothetical protein